METASADVLAKAALRRTLREEFDQAQEPDVEAQWLPVTRRCHDESESGTVQAISVEEVSQSLRAPIAT